MSILTKLINSINLLTGYIRDNINIRARSQQSRDAEIYVYLREKDIYYKTEGRRLYLLLKFLASTKSKVALVKKISFWDYRKLGIYGRKLYQIDNLIFSAKLPKDTERKILVYDREIQEWTSKIWKKLINIEFDVSLPIPQHDDWAFMPFTMHPHIYSMEQYLEIKNLQNTPRTIRLFFAGNVNPLHYRKNEPQSILGKFKIMPRATVIETVNSYLGDETLPVESWQHMELLLNSDYQQKCIILEKDKTNFNVPQTRWLEVLAKSDFFLCAPGVNIPLCHNAIESMSVGTIPVTNYPDWFFPSLKHLENCIKFTTKEDLIEAIKLVMNMEKSKIEQLRKNVIEYYEKHLSCESFLLNTVYSDKPKLTVFMNADTEDYLHKIDENSVILN